MRAYLPLLLLLSFPLFLFNIGFPAQPAGEEIHYVKAARSWVETGADSNLEHPPLAKLMIAAGISLFGDVPFGWRVFSALAAAFALLAMYFWAAEIYQDRGAGWWAALFTLLNLMLWTESHQATLEIFHVAFMIAACAACAAIWFGAGVPPMALATAAGVFIGCAIASKWFAIVGWIPLVALTLRHSRRRKTLSSATVFGALVLLPLAVYALSYAPYIAHQGIAKWFGLQGAMWTDQTDAGVAASADPSAWYSWPFQFKPVRIADELDLMEKKLRYFALIANPMVVWGGLVAIALSLRTRGAAAFHAAIFPALFFFSWAVIPHKHQHYYYFFPAVMALALPLARPGKTRWIVALLAAAAFAYYFPAVTALTTSVSVSM